MWWRKDEPQSETPSNKRSKAAALLLNNGRSSQMRKQLIGRPQPAAAAVAEVPEEPAVMHVSETGSGIEVSFSDDNVISSPEHIGESATSPSSNKKTLADNGHGQSSIAAKTNTNQSHVIPEGVVSLKGHLWRCQAVHRAQFSISATITNVVSSQLTSDSNDPSPSDPVAPVEPSLRGFQLRQHRVGLFGLDTHQSSLKFDDVLFLLRSHEIVDEQTSVQQELALLTSEIEALEQDQADLQTKAITLTTAALGDATTTTQQTTLAWPDGHRILAQSHHLPHKERTRLQSTRGLYLTVGLHNPPARDAFVSKCGMVTSQFRQQKKANQVIVELGPDNCRDGGAAATVQHVALLKASSDDTASFFISKDKGKAYCWGLLPEKLFRRMKNAGYDPKHHASDILYLATGPLGSYYAEFRNGECWWGTPSDDAQFQAICSDPSWDICRVAFGPCSVFYDKDGERHFVTSWIILGRDGRAVWKNLPARLHNLLESRLANAPACCEVALGSGSSYFVRFLDGTTDYCLPATVAETCRSLEARGASIMSISLHAELSHDFIIRSDS